MNRLITRVLIALFTFTVGLMSAKLLVLHQGPSLQLNKVEAQHVALSLPASQVLTFEDTGLNDMFLDFYRSSDGAGITDGGFRYGCFEKGSESKALESVRGKKFESRMIERTNILNDKGAKVGERVVWDSSNNPYQGATIEWSESTRIFAIHAPSVKYALAFEKSKAWVAQPCVDFDSFR
jgi:hypothetical protein